MSFDYLDDEAEPHLFWVAQSIASFAEAARVAIGHFEAVPLARIQAIAPSAAPGSPWPRPEARREGRIQEKEASVVGTVISSDLDLIDQLQLNRKYGLWRPP